MVSIAVQNVKGGVGKTTTSIHLAAALRIQKPNAKVLLVDCDAQANIAAYFKQDLPEVGRDFFDFIVEGVDLEDCIQPICIHHRDKITIPTVLSSKRLSDADIRMSTLPRREETLKLRFTEQKVSERFDYIIFDCPPTLNLVTYNIFTFADALLIPTEMDQLSVAGVQTILENRSMVKKYFNTCPEILGILPTKYDQRVKISNEVLEYLKEALSDVTTIFEPIRLDSKIKYAQIKSKTVFEVASKSKGAEDYMNLGKESIRLLKKIEKQRKENRDDGKTVEIIW